MTLTDTELALLVASIAFGGVTLGALVSGLFALLTGWLDSRRGHKRWLREQRLDSFLAFRRAVDAMPDLSTEQARHRPDASPPIRRMKDSYVDIEVLGPRRVASAAGALMSQVIVQSLRPRAEVWPEGMDDDDKRLAKAKKMFNKSVQGALGIVEGRPSGEVKAFFESWANIENVQQEATDTTKAPNPEQP